ncbi:MAG: tetratricopeptide repeat protein [Hyphomicrobiales bacterium]|nr:tetratricopeptide repeat protein [Hyphomicrobiales bacterium]MBV9428316.1 tetratricopeptide repeat protein [Bradyrhizobiaceae bacterium]
MADIFQEVDEEVRRERLEQLWKQHGNYIIAALILALACIGAWRGYIYWQERKAAEAGATYEAASTLADEGKHKEAEAAFAKLATEGTAGYRTLARFREAAQLGLSDAKAAVASYDTLAADASLGVPLQDLAAVRAGLLLVDTAPYQELRTRLEPLTAGDRPFRHSARELLAFAAWRAGDNAAAHQWIDAVVADPETPSTIRNRVDVLAALIPAEAKG